MSWLLCLFVLLCVSGVLSGCWLDSGLCHSLLCYSAFSGVFVGFGEFLILSKVAGVGAFLGKEGSDTGIAVQKWWVVTVLGLWREQGGWCSIITFWIVWYGCGLVWLFFGFLFGNYF